MVRRKQNNISLRQYLHDDLYTRHVLRPAVHGHELFHHRAGISGAWDGNNLDRCGCQHRTGSRIYLSAAYEYCRCCSRYRPRAVVFLCFCPADAETEKNAHSPDTGTDPAFYRSTHPENGLFSFFNSCNRQRDHHCPKCSPAAFWRSGIRRHSHHLRNHRTELHAAHHLADARHHRRLPAPHQLQHGCRKG